MLRVSSVSCVTVNTMLKYQFIYYLLFSKKIVSSFSRPVTRMIPEIVRNLAIDFISDNMIQLIPRVNNHLKVSYAFSFEQIRPTSFLLHSRVLSSQLHTNPSANLA